MKFRTEVDIIPFQHKISYNDKIAFMGSCFTTNIGERLQKFKFSTDVNPFGVVYNPASVVNSLNALLDARPFTAADLYYQDGLWFSYAHHSSFSSVSQADCLEGINSRLNHSSGFLQQADFLFITLGTAYAYRLNETGGIVSNCHKTPAKYFTRELLSVEHIVGLFDEVFARLRERNPQLQIIFSISPIRHLKDGAHGNQISKAVLQLAVHELVKKYPDWCNYFGAYELLLDDLRDYRFYADDMCHPSAQAVDYIWEKFTLAALTAESRQLMDEIAAIITASRHRPFNPGSEQYIAFREKYISRIGQLRTKYPHFNFEEELNNFIRK